MFHHKTHTYTYSHEFIDSHWETGTLPLPFESRWVFDSFEINKMCQNDAIIMVSEKAIYYIPYSLEHLLVEPWVDFISLSSLQLPCMVSKPGYMEECWLTVIDRLTLSLRTHNITDQHVSEDASRWGHSPAIVMSSWLNPGGSLRHQNAKENHSHKTWPKVLIPDSGNFIKYLF